MSATVFPVSLTFYHFYILFWCAVGTQSGFSPAGAYRKVFAEQYFVRLIPRSAMEKYSVRIYTGKRL